MSEAKDIIVSTIEDVEAKVARDVRRRHYMGLRDKLKDHPGLARLAGLEAAEENPIGVIAANVDMCMTAMEAHHNALLAMTKALAGANVKGMAELHQALDTMMTEIKRR